MPLGRCAFLQEELQEQMGDEAPAGCRNHGGYVSPVARLTSRAVNAGETTEECQGRIVNQSERSVAIADQQVCDGAPTLIGGEAVSGL